MINRMLLIALALLGSTILTSAASAGVAPPMTAAHTPAHSAVIQIHGWHRGCVWGPYRYHRHSPRYGNVLCSRRPRVDEYCRSWRRECSFRWEYGWRYRRCLRARGC